MSILYKTAIDKETLISALENADIRNIKVIEDVVDGNQVTDYIRRAFYRSTDYKYTVVVLTSNNEEQRVEGIDDI